MVPNISKAVREALAAGRDLSGRALIPEERAWLEAGLSITGELDKENQIPQRQGVSGSPKAPIRFPPQQIRSVTMRGSTKGWRL
jgi:hypothetical protein